MLSKIVSRNQNSNPFQSNDGVGSYVQTKDTQEAIVVDVIVNDTHPQYSPDGYNIGAIKFRLIKSNIFRDESSLNWAWPEGGNFTEYPLINEIVVVYQALNRFYYTPKLNVSSRVTSHAILGLNTEISPPLINKDLAAHMQKTVANPMVETNVDETLGDYFTDQDSVLRLRHDEGDIIIEGRSGHSIRFGTAWLKGTTNFKSTAQDQAPNILLRVGADTTQAAASTTPFGLVSEDINNDGSSIWIVNDQIISLKYATVNSPVHKASISDFPTRLDGKQIVMNTDRWVVNTKNGKILGFSFDGTHWTTNKDFTVDAGQDYKSKILRDVDVNIGNDQTYTISHDQLENIGNDKTSNVTQNMMFKVGGYFETSVNERISLISQKVYLGSEQSEEQPVPLGAILAQFLSDFIDIHVSSAATYVVTPIGPGLLSPSVVSQLTALKEKVMNGASSEINSKVTFTV